MDLTKAVETARNLNIELQAKIAQCVEFNGVLNKRDAQANSRTSKLNNFNDSIKHREKAVSVVEDLVGYEAKIRVDIDSLNKAQEHLDKDARTWDERLAFLTEGQNQVEADREDNIKVKANLVQREKQLATDREKFSGALDVFRTLS